jgi:hypothetical protein
MDENGIDRREDGGIGADPDAEGGYRDQRKHGIPRHLAQSRDELVKRVGHRIRVDVAVVEKSTLFTTPARCIAFVQFSVPKFVYRRALSITMV